MEQTFARKLGSLRQDQRTQSDVAKDKRAILVYCVAERKKVTWVQLTTGLDPKLRRQENCRWVFGWSNENCQWRKTIIGAWQPKPALKLKRNAVWIPKAWKRYGRFLVL